MGLGKKARKQIRGYELNYYLDELKTVRANTMAEFAKRDDAWLLATDEDFAWGPTNNYCKWFHVGEHESDHNGQIKFLRKRVSEDEISIPRSIWQFYLGAVPRLRSQKRPLL